MTKWPKITYLGYGNMTYFKINEKFKSSAKKTPTLLVNLQKNELTKPENLTQFLLVVNKSFFLSELSGTLAINVRQRKIKSKEISWTFDFKLHSENASTSCGINSRVTIKVGLLWFRARIVNTSTASRVNFSGLNSLFFLLDWLSKQTRLIYSWPGKNQLFSTFLTGFNTAWNAGFELGSPFPFPCRVRMWSTDVNSRSELQILESWADSRCKLLMVYKHFITSVANFRRA